MYPKLVERNELKVVNFLKIKRVALQKSDDILEAPDANTNVVSHGDDGLVV